MGAPTCAWSKHWKTGAEKQWHGASPDCFMTCVAMSQVEEQGNGATWRKHVSDEERS